MSRCRSGPPAPASRRRARSRRAVREQAGTARAPSGRRQTQRRGPEAERGTNHDAGSEGIPVQAGLEQVDGLRCRQRQARQRPRREHGRFLRLGRLGNERLDASGWPSTVGSQRTNGSTGGFTNETCGNTSCRAVARCWGSAAKGNGWAVGVLGRRPRRGTGARAVSRGVSPQSRNRPSHKPACRTTTCDS